MGDILDDYASNLEVVLTEEVEDVSKEGVKRLKADSPGNGDFAKGWKRKVEGKNTTRPTAVLYNTKYPLAHLLEFGHVMVLWGKRTNRFVEGKHFVAPINDWIQSELEDNIQVRISKGL